MTRPVLFFALILLLLSPAGGAREKDETTVQGAIDAKTFDILSAAQEKTTLGEYDAAIALLDSVRDSERLNSYARSQMWNFYAYIHASQEQYRRAIDAYQKLLAEPDAPEGLKLNSKYTLAQLYFQLEDYDAVIDFMERWLVEVEKPTSTAHIMLTQAYFQKGVHDDALRNLEQAVQLEEAAGRKIRENWLQLKVAIYYEKNDLRNVLNGYRELFLLYPRVSYLRQIAGLYGEMVQELRRLTTFDAVYLAGRMSRQSDLLNLAYMYLGQGVPYKAGQIIEAGLEAGRIQSTARNVEVLADAWAQANEYKKAIPALQRAARLSDKGLIYARLAGVYFDAGDFVQAADAAREAARKGGLKREDNNQMLLGMALFNSRRYEDSVQAFRQAKKFRRSFASARKWEQYTLNEIARLQALEAGKLRLAEETRRTLEEDESNRDLTETMGASLLRPPREGVAPAAPAPGSGDGTVPPRL